MKKHLTLMLAFMCITIFLAGCGDAPGVYILDEYLPELMDITTQYPYTEKITVKNCATGEEVEYTDAKSHSTIRMQLEGIKCIRKKAADYTPAFEVTFQTTGGATTLYIISKSECVLDGYLYEAMTAGVDTTFFENLF